MPAQLFPNGQKHGWATQTSWIISYSRQNWRFYCTVLQNCTVGYSFYSCNFHKWPLVNFELLTSVRKYEDLMMVLGPLVSELPQSQHLVFQPLYVSSCELNRLSQGWTQPAGMWFFFHTVISEGALSHDHDLDLDLDRHPELPLLQVPSALAAGSPALERWGWTMPEPHLSAG